MPAGAKRGRLAKVLRGVSKKRLANTWAGRVRALPSRRPARLAHNTRGDLSIPSTAVLGLSGWGFRAPALSCTSTGKERYFCCTLDRCGLGPAPHTVSPRSGKDRSPLRSFSRLIFGRAAPTPHQASGLRFAPALCCSVFSCLRRTR